MKLTLEPRKTTWVSFLDSTAQLKMEWKCRAEYRAHNVRDTLTWQTFTRYTFTGLKAEHAMPSSQLIMMEQGIPLAITQSVVSAVKDRFQSELIQDPFVVITDKLASLKKKDMIEKRLAKGLVERSWVEVIERSLRVENRTGKPLTLALTVVDHAAEEVEFVSSEPAPALVQKPEVTFEVRLAPDQEQTVRVTLTLGRHESIRTPISHTKDSDLARANEEQEDQQAD
jgi:hypothetical protein